MFQRAQVILSSSSSFFFLEELQLISRTDIGHTDCSNLINYLALPTTVTPSKH